jgi:imidazolonepropionase-like amidohydrolase
VFGHFAAMSNVEVLKTATSGCAHAIGLGGVTGRLSPGFAADVLFVDGDPLAELGCLTAPVDVLARGDSAGRSATTAS